MDISSHHIFESISRTAQQTPDLLAINDNGHSWTYAELERASCDFALELVESNVTPGSVVVVGGERNALLVVSLLSILKIRAVFLVVGENCPDQYISKVLDPIGSFYWVSLGTRKYTKSQVEAFSKGKLAGYLTLKPHTFHLYSSAERKDATLALDHRAVNNRVPMYLASTSGSTGKPKLVIGTHAPVYHFIDWYSKKFAFSRADRFSLLSGLGHDPMLRDIFTPLLCGGSLWIPSPSDLSSRNGIVNWIAASSLSVIHATPTLVDAIFSSGSENQLQDLALVGVGGGILHRIHVEMCLKVAPNAKIVNFYGATETPQAVAYRLIDKHTIDGLRHSNVPLGRAVDGFTLLVLDERGLPCSPAEKGQICVQSAYLSDGYYGDSSSTCKVFRELGDCGSTVNRDKAYLTGDIGSFDETGELLIHGRKDRQVKHRSYRVQLEEIDSVAMQFRGVNRACTLLESNVNAAEYTKLVCYLEADSSFEITEAHVKNHMLTYLPMYMVPDKFCFLSMMPVNHRGKIDIEVLAKSFVEKSEETDSLVIDSPTCDSILLIWSQILGRELRGITSKCNFFEVGGNSLLAVELVGALNRRFNSSMTITDLFIYPNAGELTRYFSKNRVDFTDKLTRNTECDRMTKRMQTLISRRRRLIRD